MDSIIGALARVAFGLAVAAYAVHLLTASLDEATTPPPTPGELSEIQQHRPS